ncbi:MAG: PilN domain-containing protein [Eubacteriales bacterium]|nr:hypothetical protein [Bacillota bacterium]
MIYKVNLLPARLQREGIIDFRRLLAVGGITLLSAVALGSYGIFILNLFSINSELKETRQQVDSLAPVVARVEAMSRERKELESTLEEYNLVLNKHTAWLDLLYALGDITPVDLWIVDMEIINMTDENKAAGYLHPPPKEGEKVKEANSIQTLSRTNIVTFSGYSRTVPSIGIFINYLYKLRYFKEIKLKSVSDETDGYNFKINAIIREDL